MIYAKIILKLAPVSKLYVLTQRFSSVKKREIIYFKFIRVSDAEVLILFIYFFLMNIYLGNLNYGVKEQDLQTLLEGFGAIDSVKIIVDRESGRSKGFGFAEMSDDEAAKRAIEELSGKEFAGRALVIKEARPRA